MSDTIGALAALLTTSAFLPQAVQTIRTRDTVSLSLWTYLLLVVGIVLWLIYGLMIESRPVIVANAVTVAFAGVVLVVKLANVLSGRDRVGHRDPVAPA